VGVAELNDKTHRKNDDSPVIAENQWYVLAVTSAVLTGVAIVLAFVWIFGDGFDGEPDLKKAQALSPFGVALFAVDTFCTAGWRGSINARQADQSEREGRAKLLQEGAKLLGEDKNLSHISAGLATLELLVVGSDDRLAVQAMNLIADFLQREMPIDPEREIVAQAIASLDSGFKMGRSANRDGKFETSNPDLNWKLVTGLKALTYKGGTVTFLNDEKDFLSSQNTRFQGVYFEFCDVRLDLRFTQCIFRLCGILAVTGFGVTSKFRKHKFDDCDFSSCIFDRDFQFDLRDGDNYYRRKSPPQIKDYEHGVVDWLGRLNDHHSILANEDA
jgi:hypothetical protein